MKPIEVVPDFGADGTGSNSRYETEEFRHELHDEMEMTGHAFRHRLRIEGSTTMAPMMETLVAAFADRYGTWDRIEPSLPIVKIEMTVLGNGTELGVELALNHVIDFAMASRELSGEEFAQFGPWREAFKLGSEALAIIVNAKNPLLGLDFYAHDRFGLPDRVYREIFSGSIVTWDEVDASLPPEDIHVYGRDPNGGAERVFREVVMDGQPLRDDAVLAQNYLEMAANVAADPWGIGYAGATGINAVNADGRQVTPLRFDGIEPTRQTLRDKTYRLRRPLLLVTSNRLGPQDRAFVEFLFSQKGRDIIEDAGFVAAFEPGDVRQVYITSHV